MYAYCSPSDRCSVARIYWLLSLANTLILSHRWLLFHEPVWQHVPAGSDGHTHHPQILSTGYCLADGYVPSGDGDLPPRRGWTQEPLQIFPSTWTKDNSLKYTKSEIIARGRQAERIAARAEGPDATQTAAATKRALLDLGVTGMPLFSTLSYFKCVCPLP